MVDRKEKLVSVIVPVHNAEKYLEEAVESVRKQTYTDWELILVENGSADQSLELCLVYEKRDPRIRTICESVRGIAAARNCGMQEARGTRLMFLDSDDYLADPKTIERLVCAMDKEDADIVVCNYARLWGGKILPAMDCRILQESGFRDSFQPEYFPMSGENYTAENFWNSTNSGSGTMYMQKIRCSVCSAM